jgi:hypothetical protein
VTERRPLRILAAEPATLPALAAFALLVAWAANQAGYPQTHWAPGGLILLSLLAIAIGAIGVRLASIPWQVRVAIAAFAAYTAFSFLSILWAKVPGDAWEGADRTLVYLIVFVLFASFPRSAASVALLLGAWALAMAGLAVFTVLHVDAAAGSLARLQRLMPEGRLTFPAGYTNANAALWMIAFFPSWILASARQQQEHEHEHDRDRVNRSPALAVEGDGREHDGAAGEQSADRRLQLPR